MDGTVFLFRLIFAEQSSFITIIAQSDRIFRRSIFQTVLYCLLSCSHWLIYYEHCTTVTIVVYLKLSTWLQHRFTLVLIVMSCEIKAAIRTIIIPGTRVYLLKIPNQIDNYNPVCHSCQVQGAKLAFRHANADRVQ